jgi:hypothetical protein
MLMPMSGVMMRLGRDVVGFCRSTLVLLRGTHRSHRQPESAAFLEVGRCGQLWKQTQLEDGTRVNLR